MEGNKFVELTKRMLKEDVNKNLISKNGFRAEFGEEKECVLFLGLNPAGNEENAKYESNNFSFQYIPEIKMTKKDNEDNKYFSNYFGAIYNFMLDIIGDNFKWSWCNYERKEVEKNIENNIDLEQYKNEILNYYDSHKDKKYNVLIGDLYYYHETNSKVLIDKLIVKENKYENIKEMLNYHIDKILNNNKNLRFIYVNNAQASKDIVKALTGKEDIDEPYIEYEYNNKKIKIFLGGMLSGQHTMDRYSKQRLENEVKKIINYKNI